MKRNRIFCIGLSLAMIFGNSAFGAEFNASELNSELEFEPAEEIVMPEDNMTPEAADETADGSQTFIFNSDGIMTVAQEPADTYWNRIYVDEGEELLYENFPFQIDKELNGKLGMTINLQYLRSLPEGSSAHALVTNRLSGETVLDTDVANGDCLQLYNVENDSEYLIELTELIGGEENSYAGIIATKYEAAEFPAAISLDGFKVGDDESFGFVLLKDMNDDGTCDHEPGAKHSPACNPKIITVLSEDFDSFYDELELDKIYEIQTYKTDSVTYKGFISTYPDGASMGVFERGYRFFDVEPDEAADFSVAEATADDGIMTVEHTYDPEDFENAYNYLTFHTEYGTLNRTTDFIMVRWVVPVVDTGADEAPFRMETVGIADMMFELYYAYNAEQGTKDDYGGYHVKDTQKYYKTVRRGGTGNNALDTMEFYGGEESNYHGKQAMYIVLRLENKGNSYFGFKITPLVEDKFDDYTGYQDIATENAENGDYDDYSIKGTLSYSGDVDLFAYYMDYGNGGVELTATDKPLEVIARYASGTMDGLEYRFELGKFRVPANSTKYMRFPFRDANTYIAVQQYELDVSEYFFTETDYSLDVYGSYSTARDEFDDVEYNDDTRDAVNITDDVQAGTARYRATLHYGDKDIFRIDPTKDCTLTVTLDYPVVLTTNPQNLDDFYNEREVAIAYDISLRRAYVSSSGEIKEYSLGDNVGTLSTTGDAAKITNAKLKAGYPYYIIIESPKPNSDYDPYERYILTVRTN